MKEAGSPATELHAFIANIPIKPLTLADLNRLEFNHLRAWLDSICSRVPSACNDDQLLLAIA